MKRVTDLSNLSFLQTHEGVPREEETGPENLDQTQEYEWIKNFVSLSLPICKP